MSTTSNQNQTPKLRFHWACALPVVALFAMLFRNPTVVEVMAAAVFLLIAMGAALMTWFVGRRQKYAGSLAFFCVMTVAAVCLSQQQHLASTVAQTLQLQDKFDNVMNGQLGLKHKQAQAKAKSSGQRSEAGSN